MYTVTIFRYLITISSIAIDITWSYIGKVKRKKIYQISSSTASKREGTSWVPAADTHTPSATGAESRADDGAASEDIAAFSIADHGERNVAEILVVTTGRRY